jgi:selenide,water dikinase
MRRAPPLTRDLVLVGGGHAHALVLRMWGMDPAPGVRLTLIDPNPVAPYTGMLPGLVAGHYAREDLMIDLDRLARHAGARLILGAATGIDRAAGVIHVAGRPPVAYDIASLDIGIGSGLPDLPGFAEHGVAAKPLGPFAARWEAFVADVAAGRAAPRVAVIGSGLGGVELALACRHRLGPGAAVTVIERARDPLPGVSTGARGILVHVCATMGVALRCGAVPVAVDAEGVALEDGTRVAAALVIGAAGARPQGWLAETGLPLTAGFVDVGPTLQTADPAIFAAGDCAHMTHAPRPKAGVFAVRQAPVLLHNLRAAATGGAMRRYRPQRDYLKLVSTGGRTAVADRTGLALSGAWLWRVKDRIDRAFMRRFHDLPAMDAGGEPLCGGCGAKVGAEPLAAALARLPPPARADVLAGPGDDAAVLAHGAGVQVITTDHLRPLVDDPFVMARLAALHALGDVWAMGAAPQAGLLSVILPPLSPALQARTMAEILAGAGGELRAAGADLAGGHTTEGAELTLGLTVTGLAARAVGKGGARPGDALILTRPLGSGTLFAAAMQGARAPGVITGEAVAAALALMLRPGGGAARVLAAEARAMTDVTGYGLAGHLLEMLEAAGLGARLDRAAMPFLPGAVALAAAGVRSSLWPQNRAATLGRFDPAPGDAVAALLLDPQTAGGFLAAVPAGRAAALLAALAAEGEPAALIGHVTEGPPAIRLG